MAKGKTAVGLDIGSSSVKLVQLKEKKGGSQLLAFGSAPLPPEAIVDGALMNSAAIVQAIQELVAQHKVKAREVAIGVRGHSVIIKKISLPRMTQEELDESIQWEAEQYIPFDVKDVNIDTQILTPEGGRRRADGRPARRRQEGHDQRLHLGLRRGGAHRHGGRRGRLRGAERLRGELRRERRARRWCSSTSARRSRTST